MELLPKNFGRLKPCKRFFSGGCGNASCDVRTHVFIGGLYVFKSFDSQRHVSKVSVGKELLSYIEKMKPEIEYSTNATPLIEEVSATAAAVSIEGTFPQILDFSCWIREIMATVMEGGRKDASLSGGDNEELILKTEFPPFGWSKVNAKARMRGGHVFSVYIVRDAYLNLRYAKGWAVDTENVEAKDAVRMGEYEAMVEAPKMVSEGFGWRMIV
ncbi:hypothetical protein QJS10_CPA16g00079 [Acorus calamus]|uniref:Uncharacterized protein n=1 Tax=Acorus calamus TaxID=4465 RepID=A0AAV9D1S5_ACOCL|nr:hypothetical protein QJS10_CPA16g00079 [Acorus calamus]